MLQTEKFWPKTSINENIVNDKGIQEFKWDIETTANLVVSSQVETIQSESQVLAHRSLLSTFIFLYIFIHVQFLFVIMSRFRDCVLCLCIVPMKANFIIC